MNQSDILLAAIVILLVVGFAAYLFSRRTQKETGVPEGKLVYSDTGAWRKVNRPYFDPDWGLAGKPDYVVEVRGIQIPVEVKSSSAKHPYDSHILQLAAYCRLIEVESGRRPPMGLIKYQDKVFEINYSDALEQRLKTLVDVIRGSEPAVEFPRSHDSPARCAGCGYRSECDQRLDVLHSNSSKKI